LGFDLVELPPTLSTPLTFVSTLMTMYQVQKLLSAR
jgi:hypothetical protein